MSPWLIKMQFFVNLNKTHSSPFRYWRAFIPRHWRALYFVCMLQCIAHFLRPMPEGGNIRCSTILLEELRKLYFLLFCVIVGDCVKRDRCAQDFRCNKVVIYAQRTSFDIVTMSRSSLVKMEFVKNSSVRKTKELCVPSSILLSDILDCGTCFVTC
jgi:hypothetical protein